MKIKGSGLTIVVAAAAVGIGIWMLTRTASGTPSPPKFIIGDIIQIGITTYTVRGVDTYAKMYLLAVGIWPNDVLNYYWTPSGEVDSIAIKIGHVDVFTYTY